MYIPSLDSIALLSAPSFDHIVQEPEFGYCARLLTSQSLSGYQYTAKYTLQVLSAYGFYIRFWSISDLSSSLICGLHPCRTIV